MRQKLILFFAFSLIVMSTHAQEITGVVSDASEGFPLPGATVTIEPGNRGLSTDQSGRFSYDGLPNGEYRITVSFVGYGDEVRTVNVTGNRTYRLTISLTPSVIEADEVVVTATKTERKISDLPVRMELVSAKTMGSTPAIDLAGYLRNSSGVGVFVPGGFISHKSNVVMRGMSGVSQARVLVLLDGIPVNKADGGSVHWSLFQPEQIDRIEITKGPGSSLYGGNALGGVINMITKEPQKKFQGFVKGEYGSMNTYGGRFNIGGTTADGSGRGAFYSVNGYYRQSDGYVNLALEDEDGNYIPEADTTTGTIKNDMKEHGIDIQGGYYFNENNSIKASFSYYDDQRGTGYINPDGLVSTADHDSWSASLSYRGTAGKADIRGDIWYRNEDYAKVNSSDSDSKNYSVISDRQDIGLQLHSSLPVGDNSTVTAGVDLKNGSVDAVDKYLMVSDRVYNRGEMTSFALFVQEELKAFDDRFIAVAGLRYDNARYFNGAYYIENPTSATSILQELEDRNQDENSWSSLSPRLSLLYKVSPSLRFFATYSHGFRASVLDDLCRSGFVRGGFKQANPYLGPEKLNSYEMGADFTAGSFTLSSSFYYSEGTDFMYYVSTGDSIAMGSRLRPVRRVENISGVEIKGLELKAGYDLNTHVSLSANYSYNESVVSSFDPEFSSQSEDITGMYLTYVPKHRASGQFTWRNPAVNAGLVVNHTGAHFSDDQNEVEIDPFTSLDLRLWKSFRTFSVRLDIENLTDKVVLIDDGYLNFGRFVRLEFFYAF
jgi:iron complex outermembrane receptor protein